MGHCRVCGRYVNSSAGFFGYELCGTCCGLSPEEKRERRKTCTVEGRLETGLPFSSQKREKTCEECSEKHTKEWRDVNCDPDNCERKYPTIFLVNQAIEKEEKP